MSEHYSLLVERIRRSWDATSDSYCHPGPTFLLCEETGEVAANGACPIHGGDGCLFVFVKALVLDPERNPAIGAALDRLEDERAMSEQVIKTLRDLHDNWERIIDEQDDDGDPLIENLLFWAIEDLGGRLRDNA